MQLPMSLLDIVETSAGDEFRRKRFEDSSYCSSDCADFLRERNTSKDEKRGETILENVK